MEEHVLVERFFRGFQQIYSYFNFLFCFKTFIASLEFSLDLHYPRAFRLFEFDHFDFDVLETVKI